MKQFPQLFDPEITPERVKELTEKIDQQIEKHILEKGDPEGFAKEGEYVDQGFELWLRPREAFFSVGDWCGISGEIKRMLQKELRGFHIESDAECSPNGEGWIGKEGLLKEAASKEVQIPLDKIYTWEFDPKILAEKGPIDYWNWSAPSMRAENILAHPYEEFASAGDDYLAGMVETLLEGKKLPAVPVALRSTIPSPSRFDGVPENYDYVLLDGHHRWVAHYYAGLPTINATVVPWGEHPAI